MEPEQVEEVIIRLNSLIEDIQKQAQCAFNKHLAEKEKLPVLKIKIFAPAVY